MSQSHIFAEQAKRLTPPSAKKVPHPLVAHGHTRTDNYYWLRDDSRQDPKVLAYLEAENTYTEQLLSPVAVLEKQLFAELAGRLQQDDERVPYFENGYWYYQRFHGKQEYPIEYRKKGSLNATEELLYDGNQLASGFAYFDISSTEVSPNNALLAYGFDTVGRRSYDIRIQSIHTNADAPQLAETLVDTTGNFVWGNDNQSLYYMTRNPQTLLANKVWRHKLGTEQQQDTLIYEETDSTFYTYLYPSSDKSRIFIAHDHTHKKGVSVLDANDPDSMPTLFTDLKDHREYEVDKQGDWYYIKTNWQAKDYRLMRVQAGKQADLTQWQELIPHTPNVQLTDYALFDQHLVYLRKAQGKQQVFLSDIQHQAPQAVAFNDDIYHAYLYFNREASNSYVRFYYNSPTTPGSVVDIDLKTGQRTVQKQDTVKGGFDAQQYQAEFVFLPARDGKQIPVTLVYRKDSFAKDGSNPLLQRGYGSYGVNIKPNFREAYLSLLDRGFVIATAHVRGSDMLGQQWYEDGRLNRKKNTFYDFIDVTKGLIAQGYADPARIYATGGSAGGLLMGAVANMAPELYHGIIAEVAFVDVVTTISDESLPLTSNEWAEWGNPITDKLAYDYMLSYSPYDNVRAKPYPNLLLTASLHDSQVGYFEPAKWTAKLRDMVTGNNVIMLNTNMDAGHAGASGRFKRFKEVARQYAFICTLANACEARNEKQRN